MPNFRALQISRKHESLVVLYSQNYAAGIMRGHYHESSDCFEHPKNTYLNHAYEKKKNE